MLPDIVLVAEAVSQEVSEAFEGAFHCIGDGFFSSFFDRQRLRSHSFAKNIDKLKAFDLFKSKLYACHSPFSLFFSNTSFTWGSIIWRTKDVIAFLCCQIPNVHCCIQQWPLTVNATHSFHNVPNHPSKGALKDSSYWRHIKRGRRLRLFVTAGP